jgi:hypothetical protein
MADAYYRVGKEKVHIFHSLFVRLFDLCRRQTVSFVSKQATYTNPSPAMPTPIKEAVSAEKIADDIKVVGDQIREMKASGAKSTVGVLVNELKALKARYQVKK